MAVVQVREIHDQRRGEVDKFFNRTYVRSYLVICDTKTDDPYIVETGGIALGLPAVWDLHPNDPGAYVQNLQTEAQDEDGIAWHVLVTYQTATPETNPLTMLPVPNWDEEPVEVPVDIDVTGRPLLNTAGVPFDPPITEPVYIDILTIQRNELISPSFWNLFKNCTSTSFFQGRPGINSLYTGCTGSQATYTDPNTNSVIVYWTNTHKYKFNTFPEGWKRKILSTGYQQLVSGKLQDIYVQGQVASTPQLLDANGKAVTPSPTAQGYWQYFQTKNEIDFSVFGFFTPY